MFIKVYRDEHGNKSLIEKNKVEKMVNKYKKGQTVFYFAYRNNQPILKSLKIEQIKKSLSGYMYRDNYGDLKYYTEQDLFDSARKAIKFEIKRLNDYTGKLTALLLECSTE